MARPLDLPDRLALFPLPGAVLMPRTRLPLQIFEPRYLQMIEDVLRTPTRLIGMIQPGDGGPDGLARIGCAGRVVAFSELDDNRVMISLGAQSRFRLIEVEPGFSPYLRGRVEWEGFARDRDSRPETASPRDRRPFLDRLVRYAGRRGLTTDWDAIQGADEETLVNSLAMLLPFSPEEKQALLESPTLEGRRDLLEGLLEYALRGGDDEDMIQ